MRAGMRAGWCIVYGVIHGSLQATRVLHLLVSLLLSQLLCLPGCKRKGAAIETGTDPRLGQAISTALSSPSPMVGSRSLSSHLSLARVYKARGNRPGWISGGCPSTRAAELTRALMAAGDHGLRPSDYPVVQINTLQDEARLEGCKEGRWPLSRAADLELLLSDALLLFASHLAKGRLNPEDLSARHRAPPGGSAEAALARILGGGRLVEQLSDIPPRAAGYASLVGTNRILRNAAAGGGWPTIPEGEELRDGSQGPRVVALRQRLRAAGYPVSAGKRTYGRAVEVAVEAFQERSGLEETGVVDAETLARLNSPVDEHLDRIALNLERWRWLPQDLGPLVVLVNIPGQRVRLLSRGSEVMIMKAVVGRPSRPTPQLRSAITEIVVNPSWYVPDLIASEDLLPKEARNPGYLAARGFRWISGDDGYGPNLGSGARLVQLPGRHNALGRLKLIFPNTHDVYLHDTSSPELFQKRQRFLSSGCVRLERAEALAAALLRRSNSWTGQKAEASLAGGRPRRHKLNRSVPVYLTYFTTWAAKPGALQVYEDIYSLNEELAAALK